MQITDRATEAAKVNIDCVAHLMMLFKRGQWTINKMLDSKDLLLTTPAAVKIIATHTGLPESDILEDSAVLAEAS